MKLRRCWLVLPAVVTLLSACGESSNTLIDPKANEALTTTTCQDKDFCVSGQFIDDPVVGLNYTCNLVEGVTDEDGVFSCPNNSIANFFLKSESGKRKINIGKYRVRSLGGTDGTLVNVSLIVTPDDLVTEINGKDEGTSVPLNNLLRLLQALDSDGHSTNKATNRIVIDSLVNQAIDELPRDIVSSDFAQGESFNILLEPMFDKLPGRSLLAITADQAFARYQAALPVIHAGVYEAWPTVGIDINSDGRFSYGGMLGRWDGSDLHSMVSMLLIVDRDGKTIGNALEWQKALTATQLQNNLITSELLFNAVPTHLDFNSVDTGFENNGRVKSNFILNADSGDTVKITQGTLLKGNIVGGDRFYRNIYGLTNAEPVDETKLGLWKRISSTNETQLTGTLNLQKTRVTNAYLDSTVWKTMDTVAVGEKPIFPLHLKMTLRDADRTTACGGASGNGCLIGDMGITILANGNIITDRDNDCSVVDPVTLQDQGDNVSNMQVAEQRLGIVSTVLKDANAQKIVPMMLVGSWARKLPDADPWKKFYGVYMGILTGFAGGTKVEIDVSNALNGVVTMEHQPDEQETFGATPIWTNYVKSMQFYSLSEDNKTIIKPQLKGLITSIQTQACYNPQPKQ